MATKDDRARWRAEAEDFERLAGQKRALLRELRARSLVERDRMAELQVQVAMNQYAQSARDRRRAITVSADG